MDLPAITPRAAHLLPARTQALLSTLGSTTRALEALVGEPLHVDVFEQHLGSVGEAPALARRALGAVAGTEVLLRKSFLRTSGDVPVSKNDVVALCHGDPALGPVFTGLNAPIGVGLGAPGLELDRRILATGQADWLDGAGDRRACAFKTYVFERAGEPVAYLHERFNPAFVPVEGDQRATARTSDSSPLLID